MPITLMPGMTLDQQIDGTRRAIKVLELSGRGPIWLIPSLKKRLKLLLAEKKRRTRAPGTKGSGKTSVGSSKGTIR